MAESNAPAPAQLQYNSDPHASVTPEVRQRNVKATLDGNRKNGLKNAVYDTVNAGREACKMLDTQEVMFGRTKAMLVFL